VPSHATALNSEMNAQFGLFFCESVCKSARILWTVLWLKLPQVICARRLMAHNVKLRKGQIVKVTKCSS